MTIASEFDVLFYRKAKEQLLSAGFGAEMDWQVGQEFGAFSETDLLREAAWVILCSGFRESVVRRCFDLVSLCFCDWESAEQICNCAAQCRATALTAFGNRKKIDGILGMATTISRAGFVRMKERILRDPICSVQMFPFIGPVTAFHLAKNLGYATAKPDRHLVRLSLALGYTDVHQLCRSLSEATGDPVHLVDVVLWRYTERYRGSVVRSATLTPS